LANEQFLSILSKINVRKNGICGSKFG